jgi:hypothetical protein
VPDAPTYDPNTDPALMALQGMIPGNNSTGSTPDANSSKSNKGSNATDELANLGAAQLAAQVANWAAQLEFAKQRFQLLELPQFQFQSQQAVDQLAFQKATEKWQEAYQEAALNGTYQGMPTTQWLTTQAQLTGVLNGNQTIQGKMTDAQIAQMNSAMQIAMQNQDLQNRQFGFQQTQWNAEFALSKAAQQMQYTGYTDTGAPTLQREQMENQNALQWGSLIASLRGAPNAFVQARVIGNAPQGVKSLAESLMGKYTIGGTTGTTGYGQFTPGTTIPGTEPASPYGTTTPGGFTFGTANEMAATPPTVFPTHGPPVGPGSFQVPAYTPPQTPGTPPAAPGAGFAAVPAGNDPIPGRGMDPTQWNFITQQAAQQWNANHPGFQANGSQLGYAYVGPVPQTGGTWDFNNVPGRGLDPSQWNPATQQAVSQWNATHPGFTANGSQIGYAISGAQEGGSAEPGTPPPAAAPTGGGSSDSMYSTIAAAGAGPTGVAYPNYQYSYPATPTSYAGTPQTPTYVPSATATTAAPAGEAASSQQAQYSPPGTQAPVGMWNYTPTASGTTVVHPPGVAADSSQHQFSSTYPMSPEDQSSWFSGLLPNQINARNYGNQNEYSQALDWAAFEDQGWDPGAAQDAFKKSLPRYGGPTQGSFAGMR